MTRELHYLSNTTPLTVKGYNNCFLTDLTTPV